MDCVSAEVLTSQEVTGVLSTDLRTLYRLARARRIPAAKEGGRWRFRKTDLLSWLDSAAARPAGP